MAQITFNEENFPIQTTEEQQIIQPVEPDKDLPSSEDSTTSKDTNGIVGLSMEELNDPSKISVTIADKDAPIVVLFGPPACGKTMTLVRLARYLDDQGYGISPVRSFRPTYDKNYSKLCDDFNTIIHQNDAAESTDRMSFMLVKVVKDGKTLCQLLEAPGELYFDPKNPNAPFPKYLNAIKNCKCRKIWTVMVEPDWQNEPDRLNYVSKIKKLRTQMTTKDRTIVVYNKIDMTDFLIDGSGHAYVGQAIKNIRDLYPGIFEPFKNTTPILSWFTPYRCDFTIFQTGDYSTALDGTSTFDPGPEVYPQKLWNLIMKHVRG